MIETRKVKYVVGQKPGSCKDDCNSCHLLRKTNCILLGKNSTRYYVNRIEGESGRQLGGARTSEGVGKIIGDDQEGSAPETRNINIVSRIHNPEAILVGVTLSNNGKY